MFAKQGMRRQMWIGEQRQTKHGEGATGAYVPFPGAACAADEPAVERAVESGKRTPSDIPVLPACLCLNDRVSTRTLASGSPSALSKLSTGVGNVAWPHPLLVLPYERME